MEDFETTIIMNINRFKRFTERKLDNVMTKYDLRKIDIEVIFYLNHSYKRDTAKDIAATNMFTKGHISQSIKRLTDRGIIIASQDSNDMRIQHLKLTETANPIMEDVIAVRDEINNIAFRDVSNEEMESLLTIFGKIHQSMTEEMDNETKREA